MKVVVYELQGLIILIVHTPVFFFFFLIKPDGDADLYSWLHESPHVLWVTPPQKPE